MGSTYSNGLHRPMKPSYILIFLVFKPTKQQQKTASGIYEQEAGTPGSNRPPRKEPTSSDKDQTIKQ